MHARRRGIAIVAVAGAMVLGGTPAFSAQRESIPPDVVRVFSEAALAELRQSEGADPSTTGLDDARSFGTIHAVVTWDAAFIAGTSAQPGVTAPLSWTAVVLDGAGDVAGDVTVARPRSESPAELVGWSAGSSAIAAIPADAVIIEDGPNNASFTLDDGTVAALSGFAAELIPRPVPLAEAMPIISQAYAQFPSDLPSPARTALVVVGLLLIPAGLLVLIVVMRPRVTGL